MATDITGYRTDKGGLGQDQAISQQLRNILTSKLPLLSSPGSVIDNSLYYDVTSSSVSAVEMQSTFAKDRIVLSNMTMGSSPTAYIPSQLFAGTLFWVAQLPDITVKTAPVSQAELDADTEQKWRFYAPQGWGFAALQSIIVYMGASSIAQIELDWYANFMIAMAACETASKRQAMLSAAGALMDNYALDSSIGFKNNAGAFSVGTSVLRTNKFGVGVSFHAEELKQCWGNQKYGVYIPSSTCCVPIRLPFTSMAVLEKKLSLDTKLLTQPIQLTLQTKNYNQFLMVGANLTQPVQWANSTIQMWQEELSDKSLSVRNELLANPQFNVGYPFQYAQSIPFTFPASDSGEGNVTYTGNSYNSQQITMNITSIINSDLTTMLFMVTSGLRSTPDAQLVSDGVSNVDFNQFSPCHGEELSNIQLLLNGQRFFAFDQGIYDGVSLAKQMDDVTYSVAMPWVTKNGHLIPHRGITLQNNFYFHHEKAHIYELNFSRLRSIIAESHLQNTARFTNQTFQLSFNVERCQNYIVDSTSNLSQLKDAWKYKMELHMCYLYNGVFLIGGDGGTTKLITN